MTLIRLVVVAAILATLGGCAQNHFSIPREEVEKSIRVLGVVPLMTDRESDIRHPERDLLVGVIDEANRNNEKYLVERLRETGTYFAVRLLTGDPVAIFSRLVERREKRDDAGLAYNKYFFRQEEVDRYLKEQGVDALMIVVVNGLTRREKLYAKNYLSYLESDHTILTMTAAIVGGKGAVVWEYPNFRQKFPSLAPLIHLQYPAFEEAEANATDEVGLKFRTVAGLRRLLVGKEGYSPAYRYIIDDMTSLQKRPVEWGTLFGSKGGEDRTKEGGAPPR
ncbi:MAG: lipoprotein [Desulfuromonadia bacterium]